MAKRGRRDGFTALGEEMDEGLPLALPELAAAIADEAGPMVRKLVARALVIEASSGTGVAGWGDGDCVREAESLLVLVVPALVSLREPRGELAPEPELPRRFGGAALGLGFDLELHWDWDWDWEPALVVVKVAETAPSRPLTPLAWRSEAEAEAADDRLWPVLMLPEPALMVVVVVPAVLVGLVAVVLALLVVLEEPALLLLASLLALALEPRSHPPILSISLRALMRARCDANVRMVMEEARWMMFVTVARQQQSLLVLFVLFALLLDVRVRKPMSKCSHLGTRQWVAVGDRWRRLAVQGSYMGNTQEGPTLTVCAAGDEPAAAVIAVIGWRAA